MEQHNKTKKGFKLNIHLVLIAIIVVVLGVSAVKLLKWNKGKEVELDPTEDTSEFDVEILDEILPMSTSDPNHVYDDETTVLLLGNGDLCMSRYEENGLAALIAQESGTTVFNGSFPNTTLATQNIAMIEQNYPDDIYSLSYITDAICTGDFSEIDRITNTYHGDGNYTIAGVDTLKSVDYDNLDVIVICYDAMDYFNRRAIENPGDDEERSTIVGSLNYSIRRLKEQFPYARIIVSSLFYVEGKQTDGTPYDPDVLDIGNGTLSNYFYNALNATTGMSVSYLDNFYGTINQNNSTECAYYDLESGRIVLTETGREKLAKRIAYAINLYPNDKK